MVIGFESLDQRNLQQMNKRWALQDGDYAASIRKIREHGIMIYGTFVFGYDHDNVYQQSFMQDEEKLILDTIEEKAVKSLT